MPPKPARSLAHAYVTPTDTTGNSLRMASRMAGEGGENVLPCFDLTLTFPLFKNGLGGFIELQVCFGLPEVRVSGLAPATGVAALLAFNRPQKPVLGGSKKTMVEN